MFCFQIKLGDVTELFLIDRGENAPGATHPFHLHGYSARIISYEKVWNKKKQFFLICGGCADVKIRPQLLDFEIPEYDFWAKYKL